MAALVVVRVRRNGLGVVGGARGMVGGCCGCRGGVVVTAAAVGEAGEEGGFAGAGGCGGGVVVGAGGAAGGKEGHGGGNLDLLRGLAGVGCPGSERVELGLGLLVGAGLIGD